jgi:hypothetical protein
MKNRFLIATILLFVCGSISLLQSQDRKLAQTGMKFLNVGSNARSTGMADAITSLEGQSVSMFYNPATMARQKSYLDVFIGQSKWIADINHNFASISISPENGDYGVIGISLQFVDYGEFLGTVRANNTAGFLNTAPFSPTASAIGIGYSRALSDRFSVGGNIKSVNQNLGSSVTAVDVNGVQTKKNSEISVLVYDFGMLYRTGFHSLNFGVSVRNFSKEVKFEQEEFQLPLIFKIGLSMNVVDLMDIDHEMHALIVSVDATHPRDYPEQINLGGEYLFMKTLAIRGGYMFNNDEYGYTLGFGVQKEIAGFNLGVDYSYMPFGVFSDVHRISFQLSLM